MTAPSWDGPTLDFTTGVAAPDLSSQFSIAALTGGGFVIGWSGELGAAEDADQGETAFLQVFDNDRAPVGAAFALAASLTGESSDPRVVATSDGGFAALWNETPAGGARTSHLARFAADGTQAGATVGLTLENDFLGLVALDTGAVAALDYDDGEDQGSIVVVDGEMNVSTADYPNGTARPLSAFAMSGGKIGFLERVSSFSDPIDITLRVIDAAGVQQLSVPLITGSTDFIGGFATELSDGRIGVLLQQSPRFGGQFPRLLAKIVETDGDVAVSTDLGLMSVFASMKDVVADGAGGFFGVFQTDEDDDDEADIDAIRVDATGAVADPLFPVNRERLDGQFGGQMVRLSNGDYMAMWMDELAGGAARFQGVALDPSGSTAGAPPTGIVLNGPAGGVPEESGAVAGTLSAIDADAGDSFTFELSGDAFEQSAFELDGDVLTVIGIDFGGREPGLTFPDSVTVTVTDSFFNQFEAAVAISYRPPTPVGTPGDDDLQGTDAAERIDGLEGNDTIDGAGGADTLSGGDGDDAVEGGGGDDVLRGDGGADTLDGGVGDDRLIGGVGNDSLIGGGGGDAMLGGAGDDTLLGGGGGDLLRGGPGADRLAGGTGADTLQGGGGRDTINAGGGDDEADGGGGADLLSGLAGSDTLAGGAGNDTLKGGGGNDLLDGGAGDDVIEGGRGSDTLTGGAGSDVFRLRRGDGRDVIEDFAPGRDLIEIGAGASGFDDLTITRAPGGALVSFANVEVLVRGVSPRGLDEDDFLF